MRRPTGGRWGSALSVGVSVCCVYAPQRTHPNQSRLWGQDGIARGVLTEDRGDGGGRGAKGEELDAPLPGLWDSGMMQWHRPRSPRDIGRRLFAVHRRISIGRSRDIRLRARL